MANSPAPRPYPTNYKDFEASYLGEEINDNYRYQVFHINNSGDGYISDFTVNGRGKYIDFSAYADENTFSSIFENTVIGPHQEVDIKPNVYTNLATIDGNYLDYRADAYTKFSKPATVNGSKSVTQAYKSGDYCYYEVDIQLQDVEENTYSVIFKSTYQGEVVYLKFDSLRNFHFYTREAIDLNEFEIDEAVAFLSKNDYYSNNGYDISPTIAAFLIRILVIFLIIVFFVGSLIFLLIFLPKIIRKANDKKRTNGGK